MAKFIVRRDQQAEMARLHPKPAYSRVVSVSLVLASGVPATFVKTPVFGTRLWLLSVRVHKFAAVVDATKDTRFAIFAVSGKVQSVDDAQLGQRILPLMNNSAELEWWMMLDGAQDRQWSMMMFFEGKPMGFAVVGIRGGLGNDLLTVSFEISEG